MLQWAQLLVPLLTIVVGLANNLWIRRTHRRLSIVESKVGVLNGNRNIPQKGDAP
jgi:hypothetical protein